MDETRIDSALKAIEPSRRAAIKSMVMKTAFVTPVVATFAMSGLSMHEAHAYAGAPDTTTGTGDPTTYTGNLGGSGPTIYTGNLSGSDPTIYSGNL